MSLFKVFDIAGSAMSAQSVRLNTVASNMANADSVSSSVEKTYHARRPVFAAQLDQAMSDKQASVGVGVKGIVESDAPLTLSIGLASLADGPFERPEQLFAAADEALYAAKRGGRDQLVCYQG